MVWYSHLLKNFPQFVVIHRVKDFSIVNEAEVDALYMYTLLCIKLITNEHRELYSVLCVDLNGKGIQKRGDIRRRIE